MKSVSPVTDLSQTATNFVTLTVTFSVFLTTILPDLGCPPGSPNTPQKYFSTSVFGVSQSASLRGLANEFYSLRAGRKLTVCVTRPFGKLAGMQDVVSPPLARGIKGGF